MVFLKEWEFVQGDWKSKIKGYGVWFMSLWRFSWWFRGRNAGDKWRFTDFWLVKVLRLRWAFLRIKIIIFEVCLHFFEIKVVVVWHFLRLGFYRLRRGFSKIGEGFLFLGWHFFLIVCIFKGQYQATFIFFRAPFWSLFKLFMIGQNFQKHSPHQQPHNHSHS